MHQISRYLWLGDLNDVNKPGLLLAHNIKLVISISETCNEFPGIEHLTMSLSDNTESMLEFFPQITEEIYKRIIKRENVFVHCAAGMSRGPTAVCAYLVLFTFLFPAWNLGLMTRIRSQVTIKPVFYKDMYTWFHSDERRKHVIYLKEKYGEPPYWAFPQDLIISYGLDESLKDDEKLQEMLKEYEEKSKETYILEQRINNHMLPFNKEI